MSERSWSELIGVHCAGCGRPRLFREAEVFTEPDRKRATLHKPCPECGDASPLRIKRLSPQWRAWVPGPGYRRRRPA